MSVLTFSASMSYNFFTAWLIWCLLAFLSTIKTRVLLSSIFFIADSVVRGYFTIRNWSNLSSRRLVLFLGYLGSRGCRKVLGRRNLTCVRIFFARLVLIPFRTALLARLALALALTTAVITLRVGGSTFFSGPFLPPKKKQKKKQKKKP